MSFLVSKCRSLLFGPCLLWPNGWMDQDMPHATKVGIRPSQMELDGDLALPERGKAAPLFCPCLLRLDWMDQDVRRYASARRHCITGDSNSPPQKRDTAAPTFRPLIVYCGQKVAHLSYCWSSSYQIGLSAINLKTIAYNCIAECIHL